MFTLGPHHVGTPLTIRAVRGYILDQQLTEADTVLLHPANFEKLALEYHATYREPLRDPYFLLGVLVEPALDHPVPPNRLLALCNDHRPHRLALAEARAIPADDGRPLHRCGYCGTFTDAQGHLLPEPARTTHQKLLHLRGGLGKVVHVSGVCCADKQG